MSLLDVIPGNRREQRTASATICRVTVYPFITAAARSLGIARVTLYRVLKGQYPDRGDYAARYRAFVAQQTKEAA